MFRTRAVVVFIAGIVVCGGPAAGRAADVNTSPFSTDAIQAQAQKAQNQVKEANLAGTAQKAQDSVSKVDVDATAKKADETKKQTAAGMQKAGGSAKKTGGDLKKKGHTKSGSGLEKAGSKLETGAACLEKSGCAK